MSDQLLEQTIRRLGRQPGMKLLTYREVGLPFWELPLNCRLLARKPMPALTEFVLRSVDAGLSDPSQVWRFLGLPPRVVEAVMAEALSSGSLAAVRKAESERLIYIVTERGRSTLRELAEIEPINRRIPLSFDGLLRRFEIVDPSLRWRPRDLKAHDVYELPAFPVDPPLVGPDSTNAIRPVLKDVSEHSQHDLLSVIGLDGKRTRFFKKALALVFQSVDAADEISVRIAIDGRFSEEHTRAFSTANSQRRIGILGSLQSDREEIDRILGDSLVGNLADEEEVAILRRATEGIRDQLTTLQRNESVERHDGETVDDRVEALESRLDEAESALNRMPVRMLEVHEHAPLLTEALEGAEARILIVSPWIRADVVNPQFIDAIEARLQAGVEVIIGYGIDDRKLAKPRDVHAEKQLAGLAERYDAFTFTRLGDTHAKILAVDSRFIVVTSFNWLSYRGDPNRPFRDERGTLVSLPEEIDRIYLDYRGRILAEG
ncbi:hypothetical protein R4282_10705 [Rhodococcus oxybenzonivorans]|uniref:phospholipase D-like domain-containing protein n=1 Tax=Rhodococcus oxybenzonivorans TaxID=1990687 RepID=UPI0029540C82|nr:phospholipase D-like domain-containing protein [Rhodococcus oxybenzonivorans]MDV7353474.1 hypothetical protein [Rhodococcus oxybenzonivorans]